MTTTPIDPNTLAFPFVYTEGGGAPGMTIRTYLAGQAVIGLMPLAWTHEIKATYAVQQADALIVALNLSKP